VGIKIIADTCQNHNGNRNVLEAMIAQAADAGAHYVKGQIMFSDDLVFRARFENGIIEDNNIHKAIKRPYASERERLKKLDLKEDDHRWFVDACVGKGVVPITTIFSRGRIAFAAGLPWPEKIVKVASPDIISLPFLRELCDVFDHIIVSTGGATDEEIAAAAETIKGKGKKLTLLHCVSIYPNSLHACNLSRMEFLKKFTDSVGWSDHTLVALDGVKASKVAIFLGADFVERHFTVLPADKTKDGPVSINSEMLRELVDFSRLSNFTRRKIIFDEIPQLKLIQGRSDRTITHTEALNMDYFRGRFGSLVNGKLIENWEDTSTE
jgi:N,N'-diacetyllegionaminate synthase